MGGGGSVRVEAWPNEASTLEGIARHMYGDAAQWTRIYEANRDAIHHPDRLRTGQVLRVPAYLPPGDRRASAVTLDPPGKDEWKHWSAEPRLPREWPGLDEDRADGFEVRHADLRAAGRRLASIGKQISEIEFPTLGEAPLGWNEVASFMTRVSELRSAVRTFLSDTRAEIMVAAALIGAAENRYAGLEPDERVPNLKVSSVYPRGSREPGPPRPRTYVDAMESNEIGEMMMRAAPEALNLPDVVAAANRSADDLAALTYALFHKAREIREAWRGPAATAALHALRRIYATLRGLAHVDGSVATVTAEFSGVLSCARTHALDLVLQGGGNLRLRPHLRTVNERIDTLYRGLPTRVHLALPGLISAEGG
ncbi:LysM peptidoglycan-binding domain-containing protein [Nonomuraea sp. NPDC049400]|uniref:LysM peptidoglycan-binding domain-containing protein n=1 Tax=Nonomuraea sp. NPDC049400 TaxID=3364352 RepID=UPI00378DA1B7